MTAPQDKSTFEDRLLVLMENENATAAEWIDVLQQAHADGIPEATGLWAVMAQDSLARAKNVAAGTDLLKWRAENTPIENMTGKDWVKAAEVVAGTDPTLLTFVQEAGFGQPLAARECVRRFRLLQNLRPGTLCLHPTWGFGVVQRADILYKKIELDFKDRPNHGLSMKVAVESLELLSNSHLLARHHLEPDAIHALVQNEPDQIVRLALESFGAMPVAQLQQKLTQFNLVDKDDWKRFWDAARKTLKADKKVLIPGKRNEPICLLERAAGFDDAWFDRLANDRDLKSILDKVRELYAGLADLNELSAPHLGILANRLSFVIRAAGRQQPGLCMMGIACAARAPLAPASCDWQTPASEFLRGDAIVDLLHDLPSRELKPALDFLWSLDPEAARAALLGQLPRFHTPVLQRVMELLLEQNAGDACRELFEQACAQHQLPQELLLWLMRNPEQAQAWNLPPPAALSALVIAELEQDYMGERLKTQKQLREKFEEPEWLEAAFQGLTPGRQRDLFQRIIRSHGWSGLDQQVVQTKIIKLFPQLQRVISGDAEDETPVSSGAVTSHRSYRERQQKLEHLIQVEIPENSKEISIARSYGDLSENFEYKAAKDMQSVLMARRAELETMIATVRPTDFSDAPQGVAGVGTTVELEYPDNKTETFHILGEWDQQPEMRIISSSTRLAKAIAEKSPGDPVMAPSEDGDNVPCTIKSVRPLPPEIKDWIQ